jgi:hypothetical protein
MDRRDSIRRRWRDTIISAALGAGLLVWAAFLLASTAVGALLAALLASCFLTFAYLGPASAPCPNCAKVLNDLSMRLRGRVHRCPYCKSYSRVQERLEPIPEDFVSDQPCFSVPVGRGETPPALCCVCAAPAERVDELVDRVAWRSSPVSLTKAVLRVPVPYCAEHKGGVAMMSENLAPTEPLSLMNSGKTNTRRVLLVRSYRFYRFAVGLSTGKT